MTVSKTQPMRSAEIDIIDEVNGYSATISNVESDIEQVNTRITLLQHDVDQNDAAVRDLTTDVRRIDTTTGTLQTDVDNAETAIGTLQTDMTDANTDIASLQSDMITAQTDISNAESDIDGLESALSAIGTLTTIDYSDYIRPATDVTISSASLIKFGRIAMLHVAFSYSQSIAANSQKNMFDIVGTYAPIAGCPASVNGIGASAMVNTDKALWVKTTNNTFTGSHYADCIYITAN